MTAIRTSIKLPENEYQALKDLADRRHISFTHALRQAIQSELFIQNLLDRGAHLLVQNQGGNVRELVFTQAAGPAAEAATGRAAEATTGPAALAG